MIKEATDEADRQRISAEAGSPRAGDVRESSDREGNALPSSNCVELAAIDSFPCSDPPGYYPIRI